MQNSEKIYLCEADLKEGELRGVKAENQWLVLACYQGKTYALDAACAHSGYPLFKGKLDEKGILTCPLHYMQFDCRTGKVATSPPMCADQPTFPIEIQDGKIYWVKYK